MYSDKAFTILNSSINSVIFIDEKAKELSRVAPVETYIVDPKSFAMKRKNSTLPPSTNR